MKNDKKYFHPNGIQMVSLQSALFPWFTYDRKLPDINSFVPAWQDEESIYGKPLLEEKEDGIVKQILPNENLFVSAYFNSEFQFSASDHYTLFIPMDTSTIEQSLEVFSTTGQSYQDRVIREETKIIIENVLKRHMVAYKVFPSQVEFNNITLETKQGILFINQDGFLNESDNQILKYISLPHATLFFISKEIQ